MINGPISDEQIKEMLAAKEVVSAEDYALLLRERDKLLEAARRAIGVIGSMPSLGIEIEAEKAYLALREAITNAEAEAILARLSAKNPVKVRAAPGDGMTDDTSRREMQAQIDRLQGTLVTLILWMSGSAVSPIRRDEAEQLIAMADGTAAKKPVKV